MEALGGWPMVAGLAALFTLAVSMGTVFVVRRQPGSEYALQGKVESVERLVNRTREEYVPRAQCACLPNGGVNEMARELRGLIGETREEMAAMGAKIDGFAQRLGLAELRMDRFIGDHGNHR